MKAKTTKKRPNKKLSELLAPKKTWCDYADERLTPKYLVYRFDDKKGNRFYYFKYNEEWIIAAGVTTVFGLVSTERERINQWKNNNPNWQHLLDISSEYGTMSHIQKGGIMFGKGVDLEVLEKMTKLSVDNGGGFNTPAKDMLAFMKFQEDYSLIPLLIEALLVWQDPISGEWLAMTIDLLAKMVVTVKTKTQEEDGVYQRGDKKGEVKMKDVTTEEKVDKILLVDFKSNFFEKDKKSFFEVHKEQLMAGKLAVEQNFDIKVDDIYNFSENSWRTEPSYTFYKWNIDDSDWKVFYAYWNLALAKGINKPQGNMLVTEGFKDSKDFKFLTYKEYVEQVLTKG
jgi:hypothetical protein